MNEDTVGLAARQTTTIGVGRYIVHLWNEERYFSSFDEGKLSDAIDGNVALKILSPVVPFERRGLPVLGDDAVQSLAWRILSAEQRAQAYRVEQIGRK